MMNAITYCSLPVMEQKSVCNCMTVMEEGREEETRRGGKRTHQLKNILSWGLDY